MDIIKDKNKLKKNNFFIFISKTNKLEPIKLKLNVKYSDLLEISDQKKIILKNTEFFIEGKQSNNILLWGAKGMKVQKGELIGSVGNTGNVRSPQLHFEIRKGKESVNPLKLL